MPTPNQLTTTDRFLANVPFSWGQVLLPMSPHPLDSSCSACAFPSALVVYSGGGRPKVGESNLAEPQASKQASNQVSCSERRSIQWSGRFLSTIGWDPSVYKSSGDDLMVYIVISISWSVTIGEILGITTGWDPSIECGIAPSETPHPSQWDAFGGGVHFTTSTTITLLVGDGSTTSTTVTVRGFDSRVSCYRGSHGASPYLHPRLGADRGEVRCEERGRCGVHNQRRRSQGRSTRRGLSWTRRASWVCCRSDQRETDGGRVCCTHHS